MTLRSIRSVQQLATKLGRDHRKNLLFLAYRLGPTIGLREFQIPKRGGGLRTIKAPNRAIIKLQREINLLLEADHAPKIYAHGFVKGRSISTNADQHVGNRWVLNIDLKDFFGSITFARVYGRLKANPYKYAAEVAAFVAHISCANKTLIPGGATSPTLSNFICDKMDAEIARICRSLNCAYSRYADDITISSNRAKFPTEIAYLSNPNDLKTIEISDALTEIIEANGFKVNPAKTRLQSQSVRQEVTGLVVNKKRNVPRSFIRQVRCALHAWEKFGLDLAADAHFNLWRRDKGRLAAFEAKDFEWVMRGKIEFVRQVKGSHDPVFQNLAKRFNAQTTLKKFKIVPVMTADILREAVWVIEGVKRREVPRRFDRAPNILQRVLRWAGFKISTEETSIEIFEDPYIGTAFFAEGIGIVTCAHCYEEGAVIYHPEEKTLRYNVKLVTVDASNDICVLEAADIIPAAFQPKAKLKVAGLNELKALKTGDQLQFAGFPANLPENQISIKVARISRFLRIAKDGRALSERERQIVLDGGIMEGTSGGPVLAGDVVVGIAARGAGEERKLEASVVVPITTLPTPTGP